MASYNDSSAYPHPEEFTVMRPDFYEQEDGFWRAVIRISPFKVSGQSRTKAGARRAALYEAQKTYRSHHPSYTVQNPYPESFTDREDVKWRRVPRSKRSQMGDYIFVGDDGEEDYVDIETMLMWDIRPAEESTEAVEE